MKGWVVRSGGRSCIAQRGFEREIGILLFYEEKGRVSEHRKSKVQAVFE